MLGLAIIKFCLILSNFYTVFDFKLLNIILLFIFIFEAMKYASDRQTVKKVRFYDSQTKSSLTEMKSGSNR